MMINYLNYHPKKIDIHFFCVISKLFIIEILMESDHYSSFNRSLTSFHHLEYHILCLMLYASIYTRHLSLLIIYLYISNALKMVEEVCDSPPLLL